MNIVVDASWVAGLLLAMIRVAAFVVASPIFSRAIPFVGRSALVVVLGLFFADPVEGAALGLDTLLVAGVTNAMVGIALGFLTGVIFHLFTVAGNLIDFSSTLSAASVFDPMSNSESAVFGRMFNLTALALFFTLGGDRLVVRGLATSFDAIDATGTLGVSAGGLAEIGVTLVGRLMVAAVELAMPALAALFVAELVLGIAARFAPQANVFLLGLPAKVLAALASVSAVLLLMPETIDGVLHIIEDTFLEVVGGMAG